MNSENHSDNEIVQAVLAGATERFGELLERYEKLVFSFLLSRLKNLQEVEDIAQDTFVKAFRHLKSFDCSRKFTAWLLTIARNVLIDHVRKSSRSVASTELVTEVMLRESDNEDCNPQMLNLRRESWRKVMNMINTLSEEVRDPFVMRVVNEMSYQEIADALELPLQTVKNRIFKARSLLREKRDLYEEMS
ncbi:MAG: RNA polymerase sigma factor [Candidatus Riflebacteria bacterium]